MLEVRELTVSYGGTAALRAVDVTVVAGELRGLIGPNGAGKSTLFAAVAGHLRPDSGSVWLSGTDMTRWAPHRRAAAGLGMVFQNAQVFPGMTVLENVMVGAYLQGRAGLITSALRLPRQRREDTAIRKAAMAVLERVGLAQYAADDAVGLPVGFQRMLQVARALCGRPRLLLLDEPAAGLRAAEKAVLAGLLTDVHAQGMTMVLVEHDVAFVTGLADSLTALVAGEVVAQGPPAAVVADPSVRTAYLGSVHSP